MPDKDRFFELLAKKKLNTSTLKDIAELNQLLKDYNLTSDDYKELDSLFNLKFIPQTLPSVEETHKSWEQFQTKLNRSLESDSGIKFLKKAVTTKLLVILSAVAMLCVVFNILFLNKPQLSSPSKLNVISTRNGSKTKVQMPDGTMIWLNAGSKISYDRGYGISNRNVTLNGEAYFDVKHDAKHPFIIHTRKLCLKVLGTSFNVRAYNEDRTSEATLIRGSLEISFAERPKEKMILKPNEKMCLAINTDKKNGSRRISAEADANEASTIISLSKLAPADNNEIEEVAWIEDKLVFRKKTFGDLALDLERRYDVKIKINNTGIIEKKFTGIFKNETIIDALEILKASFPFIYTYDKANNTFEIQPIQNQPIKF